MQSVAVRRHTLYTSMAITYRWRGRAIVGHIVIGCVDILHFTWHSHISHWPKDALAMSALLVITIHMRVLRYDIHERTTIKMRNTVRNAKCCTWPCGWWRAG